MTTEMTQLHPVWIDTVPLQHVMLRDVGGSLAAVLTFALVLYAPGYVVAYAADFFGFRQMGFVDRSKWAIACSFCVVPMVAYLSGRSAGLASLCWLLAGLAIAAAWLLWRRRCAPFWSRHDKRITALIAGGWTVFVLLMLVDVQVGHKLYFSVVTADFSYRVAFTDAVVRTGIPPANPLYFAGKSAAMPYYYFWYVLCAVVVKIAHVTARQAFIASSVWAGFGLLVTVDLYTRHFFHWARRQRWIALGLLVVTGADLLPALGNAILQPSLNGDMEWWSVDPIDAWPDSLLWVPHHVAAVLCCLLAFLFLWRTLEPLPQRQKRWAVVLTALAFASAFGLSIYVAFGFALLVVAWLVWLWVRRDAERGALCGRVIAASLLSAVLLAPFVWELAGGMLHGHGHSTAAAAPAPHMFSLSVRPMIDSGLLTGLPLLAHWNQAHPILLDQAIRLLLLLPGLAMELGLYGAVLVMLLLAKRRGTAMHEGPAQDTALFLTLCGLALALFLSSSMISNNDFGYREVMLPQFFLTLLAADVLGGWWAAGKPCGVDATPGRRRLLTSLLVLGVAGSIYAAVLLRAWLPFEMTRPQDGFNQLPQDAFEIREAFAALDRVASPEAVVSFRPVDLRLDHTGEVMTPEDFYQRMLVMDAGRQMLNAEEKCADHFGGDPAACSAIQNATAQLYSLPSPSADWAREYCRRFGVQYLLLGHRDPDWSSRDGWPVALPYVAQEPGFRILQCAAEDGRTGPR